MPGDESVAYVSAAAAAVAAVVQHNSEQQQSGVVRCLPVVGSDRTALLYEAKAFPAERGLDWR